MLKEYNDLPDERRYPFVVPADERMPTPSQRVRMRRKAGLMINWDDHPDSLFFGYNPSGRSDDEDDDAPSPPRVPGTAAMARAAPEALSRSVVSRATQRAGTTIMWSTLESLLSTLTRDLLHPSPFSLYITCSIHVPTALNFGRV